MAKRKTVKKNKLSGLLAILGGVVGLAAITFVIKGGFLKPAEVDIFEVGAPSQPMDSRIFDIISDEFDVLDTRKWWVWKTPNTATVGVKDGKLQLTVPKAGTGGSGFAQIKSPDKVGGRIPSYSDIQAYVRFSKPQLKTAGVGASTIILQESAANYDPIMIIDWVQKSGEDFTTLKLGSYVDNAQKFFQQKQIRADELLIDFKRTGNVYAVKYTSYRSGQAVANGRFNSFTLNYPDPVSFVLASRNDRPLTTDPAAVVSLFDSITFGVGKN